MRILSSLIQRRILPKNTPVHLELLRGSQFFKNHSLQGMEFKVLEDVKTPEGDMVLIRSGAPARGQAFKRETTGRNARREFTLGASLNADTLCSLAQLKPPTEFVVATDDTMVPLVLKEPVKHFSKKGNVPANASKETRTMLKKLGLDRYLPAGTKVEGRTARDIEIDAPNWFQALGR